jgi:hypothetical protein
LAEIFRSIANLNHLELTSWAYQYLTCLSNINLLNAGNPPMSVSLPLLNYRSTTYGRRSMKLWTLWV